MGLHDSNWIDASVDCICSLGIENARYEKATVRVFTSSRSLEMLSSNSCREMVLLSINNPHDCIDLLAA
nr:MAG TPA_asm: hypothetical protein [Caudoviricetes sp.]